MSQFLGRFGTRGVFEDLKKKAVKHKCLTAFSLENEVDETRTRNLRIDSPML